MNNRDTFIVQKLGDDGRMFYFRRGDEGPEWDCERDRAKPYKLRANAERVVTDFGGVVAQIFPAGTLVRLVAPYACIADRSLLQKQPDGTYRVFLTDEQRARAGLRGSLTIDGVLLEQHVGLLVAVDDPVQLL